MPRSLLDKLTDALHALPGDVLRYALPAAAAVIALWIVWRLMRRRKRPAPPLAANLMVEVAALSDRGPPEGPPVLEFYNLPVRLAAVVLAPVGPGRELPKKMGTGSEPARANPAEPASGEVPVPIFFDDQLGPLLDAILPGLDKVAALHRPVIRRWPNQVSARGFAHLFFNNARLPGQAGKGTPWSSVAGVVKVQNQPVMAGLVLRAAAPNSLGQTIIDAEYKWLGCLRVRWS
jgi:hypothetical protein